MPVVKPAELVRNRVEAIQAFHKKAGLTKAELDLSGGIDSAVMACLLVKALGPENVILVHSRFKTSNKQSIRAGELAFGLGCPLIDFDGEETWNALMLSMTGAINKAYGKEVADEVAERVKANPTILGSIRSCLRAPIGRGFNRMLGGGIRHGTGNECEDRFVRFFQKGGDGEVDTNPIEMLSKLEVYQLAYQLAQEGNPLVKRVLTDTIKATPSPDLWGTGDGHTDEAELLSWLKVPFTYGRINPETGEVVSIGTIERVARFLDLPLYSHVIGDTWIGKYLFDSFEPVWKSLVTRAQESGLWDGFTAAEIEGFLKAARKAEHDTRHKNNSTIPTLGTREALVAEGILTNTLTIKKEN